MKPITSLLLIAVISCGLPACSIYRNLRPHSKKTEEKPKEKVVEVPKLVGRVASISADKKFVLIQSYGKWSLEAGAILTTRGEDEHTANLLATGEVLGEFAAADIKAGLVNVGDAVYFRPVPKPEATPATPPATEKPDKTKEGNVQKNI